MKRNYESMVILQPDLSDQDLESIFDKIIKKIEELEGKVSDSKIWQKESNFHFFIQSRGAEKKKYYKGCYWLVNFSLEVSQLPGLKELIRLEERILRSVIINREHKMKPKFIESGVQS